MKIDTSSTNNIHVFRVNRPATKNNRKQPQPRKSYNSDSACSRTSLSAETKRSICEHHISHPKCTQEALAIKFGCKRSTIAKIIKSKERWLSIDTDTITAKRFRQRNSRFPLVENALKLWLQKEQENNLAGVTDQMLRYQARQYAQAFSVEEDFKASSSWITNFKQKYIESTISVNKPTTDNFILDHTVKKFTTVFAIDTPSVNSDQQSKATPSNHLLHSTGQRSPSSLDLHPGVDSDNSEDIPQDDCDMPDYGDNNDDYSSPDLESSEPLMQDSSHDDISKTNMTKLNAKKHLEAALAFYNSQTEGSSSMSANMIKLILQNDFL